MLQRKIILLTSGVRPRPWRRTASVRVGAGKADSDGVRWWEKDGGPNFHDVHSTQEFVDTLSNAGDKLVVVEFYASWCGFCRALYPKLCKLATEHLDVEFMKVNFEENKPMCKSSNIKVLSYFYFYRGAEGRLDAFSCSLAKLQKLGDAIQQVTDNKVKGDGTVGGFAHALCGAEKKFEGFTKEVERIGFDFFSGRPYLVAYQVAKDVPGVGRVVKEVIGEATLRKKPARKQADKEMSQKKV